MSEVRADSSPTQVGPSEESELLGLDRLLTEEERVVRDDVREFVQKSIKPSILKWGESPTLRQEIRLRRVRV
jgi:hypothetical protein